jgi:hypothetical protein
MRQCRTSVVLLMCVSTLVNPPFFSLWGLGNLGFLRKIRKCEDNLQILLKIDDGSPHTLASVYRPVLPPYQLRGGSDGSCLTRRHGSAVAALVPTYMPPSFAVRALTLILARDILNNWDSYRVSLTAYQISSEENTTTSTR